MRIAALSVCTALLFGACSSSQPQRTDSQFAAPNMLVGQEIDRRINEMPYQHGEELYLNMVWLSNNGETAIPSLLKGIKNENAKVRSSCIWVLGLINDRRTIPSIQPLVNDSNERVSLEAARTLVVMGDIKQANRLIAGLDSDHKEVRYLCHETLKTATGRDFGYDHLSEDLTARRTATLGWCQWWSDYSGDASFASSYAQRHQLGQPAAPMGETNGTNGQGNGQNGQNGQTNNQSQNPNQGNGN